MMMPRTKTATPNRTRTSSRRSSENPTNSPHAPQLRPEREHRPRGPYEDEFATPLLDRLLFAGQLVCERRNNEESRCRLSLSSSFAAVHQLGSNWRHTGLGTDIVIPSKMTRTRRPATSRNAQ